MTLRFLTTLLLIAYPLSPTTVHGQAPEDEDKVQIIQAPPDAPKPPAPDLGAVTQKVIDATNRFRRDEKRAAVAANANLTEAAKYFADYMARTARYGHTADGARPTERAAKHGYESCLVAENIAYAYNSKPFTADDLAKQFVEGWKNSPGHRKNMLDPDVTETGVAVARSEQSGYFFAVQMFGRPKSAEIEFRIANRSDTAVKYTIEGQSFDLPPRLIRTHQHCRPPEVVFPELGGEAGKTAGRTLHPKGGERFAVVSDGGGVKVVTDG
jgi:uncharacterized protein YkwD